VVLALLLQDKYGEIEEMNVCDNLGDHLVGNVYIKFKYELDAESVGISSAFTDP
jgi:splicing factor U2AF subunit